MESPFKHLIRDYKAKGEHFLKSPFCWCKPEIFTTEEGMKFVIHKEVKK